MKKLLPAVVTVLFPIMMLFESCSPPFYLLHNEDELLSKKDYKSGNMPFRLRSSDLGAPMLSRKGQLTIDHNVGGGFGTNAAYAISNKIGIYAKGSIRTAKSSTLMSDLVIYQVDNGDGSGYGDTTSMYWHDTSENRLQEFFWEAGAGIYKVKPAHDLRMDLFGGLGTGMASNTYELSSVPGSLSFDEKRHYLKIFAQNNWGIEKKAWEVILMNRLSYYYFYSQEFHLGHDVPTYEAKTSALALEEGLRLGAGGGLCKVFVQYEVAIPILKGDISWYHSNLKAGLSFKFGDQIRKDRAKKEI